MTEKALLDNLAGIDESVGLCLEKRRVLPALALLYAGLDIVASLERAPNEQPKSAFLRWVNSYMKPDERLGCTAIELYGARCGILHASSAESNLSREGKARQIMYAWGNADVAHLRQAAANLAATDVVSLHLNDLRLAFRSGVEGWWQEVVADHSRLAAVRSASGKWFIHVPKDVVKAAASSGISAG